MMISTSKNKEYKEIIYTIISVVVLILLWKILAIWVGKEIILPSPEATFSKLIMIIRAENFLQSILSTLIRSMLGFSIAFLLALILGMLAGFFKPVYYLLKPVIVINKAIPTMAVILLALIWLESEKAPILVGFLVIFPLLYYNVVEGIRSVDEKLIEMVKLYQVNKVKVIKELYIPSIKSYLIAGASTALGLNLKIVIAAEVLSQPKISMGTNFQIEKANLNTAGVFAWAIIAIVMAAVLDGIVKLMQRN
uniref:ABC-type nitrate/sulfonate/bicarbonate transport system, permease component n=1 Tax=Clostridium aceticum TaxID=84022 RepID=A0A0D8ICP0_9CLOT|nr:ABC transporter permease subunit [Clostridium aceticum]AKL96384.1 ABC-type nitrate/sulfonate/bicarbonate transport system, permease component [Clostridium aceticum]KJF26961.1 ABC transporter permease [Clostridium aceticum]